MLSASFVTALSPKISVASSALQRKFMDYFYYNFIYNFISQNGDGISSRELLDKCSYMEKLIDHLHESIKPDKFYRHEKII